MLARKETNMGRKPKSLAELELSGALAARPGRYKERIAAAKAPVAQYAKNPATPLPLGSAPKWLSTDEKAIWKELAKTYPNLTFSDRFHLEIACKLTNKMRTAEGGLKGQELTQLIGILDGFKPEDNPAPDRSIKTDSTVSAPQVPIVDTRTPAQIEYEDAWEELFRQHEEDMEQNRKLREGKEMND
jgi:phage terminase small subunit